jgi:hypothetical protein
VEMRQRVEVDSGVEASKAPLGDGHVVRFYRIPGELLDAKIAVMNDAPFRLQAAVTFAR